MTAPTIDEVPDLTAAKPMTTSGRRERIGRDGSVRIYRHTLWVRIGHWLNVMCLSLLLLSGLQIFNAQPHLYWGQKGSDAVGGADRPFLSIVAVNDPKTGKAQGVVDIGDYRIVTTGVFGLSAKPDGTLSRRAFPRWLTMPSYGDLASGRAWHFFFAWLFVINGLVYWAYGFVSRHFQRDMAPTGPDWRGIGRSIIDHIRLKHPTGEAAARYNVLQKLAYIGVIFGLLPLMVLTGLTMSPGFDAFAPGLLDLFGGRQSARSIHFICAGLIVTFVVVHLVEVVIAGAVNEMRSIITGWYALPPDHPPKGGVEPPEPETPAVEVKP